MVLLEAVGAELEDYPFTRALCDIKQVRLNLIHMSNILIFDLDDTLIPKLLMYRGILCCS